MTPSPSATPANVLIVKFGAIGDVIMAVTAVSALAEQGARIDWLCSPVVAPLLACYSWINPIVADDHVLFHGRSMPRIKEILRIWKLLAGRRYDLCATLYYDPRYRILTLPVRATRKLRLDPEDRAHRLLPGRSHADDLTRILLQQPDSCRDHSRLPAPPGNLPPSPLPPARAPVRIALVPGGASNMLRQQTLRRWPLQNYAEVARRLLDRGWEVVLTGGPDDTWVRPAFASLPGPFLHDTIGSLTLPQLVSAYSDCTLVLSHDTGPLHLAGITTASILALFGPTDPAAFLPRRPGTRGIWGGEGFACRPCHDGRDFAPCSDNACMAQITVDMAMHQIDALLGDRNAAWRVVLPSTIPLHEASR